MSALGPELERPEADMTGPDAWKPIRRCKGTGGRPWRVGRVVDSAGTIEWLRYRRGVPAGIQTPIITFAHISHAEARAEAQNLADAGARRHVNMRIALHKNDPPEVTL